jgi:membrane protease YdiL (CAAX protease family)
MVIASRLLPRPRLAGRGIVVNACIAVAALAIVTVAELITTYGDPRFGIGMHITVLVLCLCFAAMTLDESRQTFYLTLAVAPIIRIISTGMPLRAFPQEFWYLLTSIPLFIAAIFIARAAGLGTRALNLQLPERRYLRLELLVWVSGLALGCIEWLILRPDPVVGAHPFAGLVGAGLILLVCTGFIEELLFRGLVQYAAGRLLGVSSGILFTAGLFAVLHIGHRSVLDVAFVGCVGIYFSLVVQRTRSLLGVTFAHGTVNIMLFIVLPLAVSSSQHGPHPPRLPLIIAQRATGQATTTSTPASTSTPAPVTSTATHTAVAPTATSSSTPLPPPPSPTATAVPPTHTPTPGGIVVAGRLTLSRSSVAGGESLTASAMLRNTGDRSLALRDIVIAARPPGGTNAGGPFDDFGGTDSVSLAPGQTAVLRKTRPFTAADPQGVWYAFVTYQTADGVWHDDPLDLHFSVVPGHSSK